MRQDSAGSEIKEPKPQVQLEKETTGYIQDSPNILFSFENCNIWYIFLFCFTFFSEDNNEAGDFKTPQGRSLRMFQNLDEVQSTSLDEDEKIVIVQNEQMQDKFPNAVGLA